MEAIRRIIPDPKITILYSLMWKMSTFLSPFIPRTIRSLPRGHLESPTSGYGERRPLSMYSAPVKAAAVNAAACSGEQVRRAEKRCQTTGGRVCPQVQIRFGDFSGPHDVNAHHTWGENGTNIRLVNSGGSCWSSKAFWSVARPWRHRREWRSDRWRSVWFAEVAY